MGSLAQLVTKKTAVIMKMDPITEELERGSNGLCKRVHAILM